MFILPNQRTQEQTHERKRGSLILLDVENRVEDPQILGSPVMKSGYGSPKKLGNFKPYLHTTGHNSDDGRTNEQRVSLPPLKSSFELD